MSRRDEEQLLDVDALLRVDVVSELDRVASAQLEGPWQIPSELVRRAIAAGASRVSVALRRNTCTVVDQGDGISPEQIEQLAILLNEALPSGRRHEALATLESVGATALVALAGLKPKRLLIDTGATGLVFEHGAEPRLQDIETKGTRIFLEASLDPARANEWLRSACRFAPVPVICNEEDVAVGFADVIRSQPLPAPLSGRVALPQGIDTPTVWLLDQGVVTAHMTVADAVAFEAALDLSGLSSDKRSSAAELRDAASSQLDVIKESALALVVACASDLGSFDEATARRIRRTVLDGLATDGKRGPLSKAPVFLALTDRGRRLKRLSLRHVRQAAQDADGALTALFPGQAPEKYVLPDGIVLVLEAQERSVLTELLGAHWNVPQTRTASRSVWASLRLALQRLGDRVRHATSAVRLSGIRPVDPDRMSADERRLVAALGVAVRAEPILCAGSGRVRVSGDTLVLPRENPMVVAAAEVIAADPTWVYAAGVALLDGRGLPRRKVRSAWVGGR